MHDDHYFVLIKPNIVSPAHLKGYLFLKRKLKQILETMVDKTDTRNMFIAYSRDEHSMNVNDDYDEINIYFEDWRKSLEMRDVNIDEKRKQ